MNLFFMLYFTFMLSINSILTYISIDNNFIYYVFFLIPLFFIKKSDINFKQHKYLFYLILGMSIIATFSGLINGSLRTMLNGPIFFVFFLSFLIVIPRLIFENFYEIIIPAILISLGITLFLSFSVSPSISIPYYGHFTNPNSFAIMVLPLYILLLSETSIKLHNIYFFKNHKSFFTFIILSGLTMSSLGILIISRSRTSVLTALAIIFMVILLNLLYSFKYKRIGNFLVHGTYIIPIVLIFLILINLFGIPIIYLFETVILDKFSARSGDLFSGRTYSWETAFEEIKLFGHGQYYFLESVGLGAHNTFINQLGIHGILFTILFITLIGYLIFHNLKFVLKKDRNKLKFHPIFFLLAFVLISMGEDIIFNELMLMAIIFSGYALMYTNSPNHFE